MDTRASPIPPSTRRPRSRMAAVRRSIATALGLAMSTAACSGPTPPAEPPRGPWISSGLPALEAADLRAFAASDKRPVVLVFWASWCAPCIEDFPRLSQLHASGRARVVGLATEEPATSGAAIENTLNRVAPTFPQGRAAPAPDRLLAGFGLVWTGVLPAHVVLLPDGTAHGPFVGAWDDVHLAPAFGVAR